MRLFAALVLALAAVPMAAKDALRGEICLAGVPCRDFVCGQSVEASAEPRSYTFTASGGSRHDFGVLESGATHLACDANAFIRLRIEAPVFPRGGAVRLAITTPDKKQSWSLQVREQELKGPIQLYGPAGSYDVRLDSDGYLVTQKTITLGNSPNPVNAKLEPLPTLAGRVIDRATGAPVAGSLILAQAKAGRAVSGSTGQFALALDPNDWPKTLTVSAGGYSDLILPVPPARSSGMLGDVTISRGGTIAVQLQPSKSVSVSGLELYRVVNGGRTLGPMVQTRRLEHGAEPRTEKFENVEPGDYLVEALGGVESERLAEPVVVAAAEESRLTLEIVPFRLRIQTRSHGDVLPKAHVSLRNRDVFWKCAIATDDDGNADLTLWQAGRFNATVENAGSTPYLDRRNIERNDDTEWIIDIPALEVRGVVIDSTTGRPVPDAGVALTVESTRGFQLAVHTQANSDGAFRFAPVSYGEHTLKAAAHGYPVTQMTYTFQEPETSHDVTVKLEPAPPIHLSVADTRGTPVSGARALQFNGLNRSGLGVTDSAGGVDVLVPAGETRDVFVVPRDGSFTMVRLVAGRKEIPVVIPDGTSRLVLRMETADGKPIPSVAVVVRYNGIVIPYEVIVALMSRQAMQLGSDAQGRIVLDRMPVGVYEFWPVGSAAELREVAAGAGPSAPVRIAAAPGENVSVMTFQPVATP
jgi:hypothetical protein